MCTWLHSTARCPNVAQIRSRAVLSYYLTTDAERLDVAETTFNVVSKKFNI